MSATSSVIDQFRKLPPREQMRVLAQLNSETLVSPESHSVHRLADLPSIVRTPNVCGGSARILRTRIPIWLLQQLRQLGFSDAKILECYPTLTAGDLVAAWEYVATHWAEIDKEIEENERY